MDNNGIRSLPAKSTRCGSKTAATKEAAGVSEKVREKIKDVDQVEVLYGLFSFFGFRLKEWTRLNQKRKIIFSIVFYAQAEKRVFFFIYRPNQFFFATESVQVSRLAGP